MSQKTHHGQNHQEVGNARLASGEPHFLYPKSSPPVKKIVHPLPPSPQKNHGNIVIEASGWGAGLDHFLSLLPSPKMLSPTQKGVFQFPCDQTQFDPDPDEIPGLQDPDTTDGGKFRKISISTYTHTDTVVLAVKQAMLLV